MIMYLYNIWYAFFLSPCSHCGLQVSIQPVRAQSDSTESSPGESAVDTDSGLQLGDCCGILGISNMFERFRRAGPGQVLADLV